MMAIKLDFNSIKSAKLAISLISVGLVLGLLLSVLAFYVLSSFPNQTINLNQKQLYTVTKGMGFNQMCRDLVSKEIIKNCGPLKWFTKFTPKLRKIKAGLYELDGQMTHLTMLEKLTSGVEHQFDFTIVEGEQLKQVLAKVVNAPYLTQDIENGAWLNSNFKNPYDSLEGLLYPDTYYYSANSSARKLLLRAYQRMDEKLHDAWDKRADNLPYDTAYQALIMASIIEKETGQAVERPVIASVFVNRLRKKMRLQTDPTVIYGLGDAFDGDITRAHLRQKTPYNTYRINGLPPTPIAMPAIAAIDAALNPDDSPYIYFVSKKDGSHHFSTTLAEHNQAVRYYQLGKGAKP